MDQHKLLSGIKPAWRETYASLGIVLSEGWLTGRTLTRFMLFETWRSPERQQHVYDQGKSKALPYHSAHQHGLAGDYVAWVKGEPSWDPKHDWMFLKLQALKLGLDVPIKWDLGHVEVPNWRRYVDTPPWMPDYARK